MTTETRRQAQLARQRECCEMPTMTTDTRPMMVGTYRLRWSPATEEGPGCWEVIDKDGDIVDALDTYDEAFAEATRCDQADRDPEPRGTLTMGIQCSSLLPIDVGFDLRIQHMLVRLTELPVRYAVGSAEHQVDRISSPDPESAAEELARAGYSVVAFQTANGRDIQCTPADQAPEVASPDVDPDATPGYAWTGTVWSAEKRDDNYWCNGPSLVSALSRAGWTLADLRPLFPPAAGSRVTS